MLYNFDNINLDIKFNYNGYPRHVSTFGVILSMILYAISLAFGVYAIRELWEKKKPISNIIQKYTSDAGVYHLGIGGINHFFDLLTTDGQIVNYDPKAVVIESVMKDRNGLIKGSYKYDNCKWDLEGVDFHEMTDSVKKEDYEKSMCIRHFKNFTTGETIILDNETKSYFPYPNITHGMESTVSLSEKNVYFITVKECTGDTCYPKETIKEFLKNKFYRFKFIDKKFDITNFKFPISNQLNQVEGLISDKTFTANHLNLNPSTVNSNNGFILDNIETSRSIYMIQNEKIVSDVVDDPIVTQVNFWLKNQETIYERNYLKAQDILASIGGFFNALYIIALIINFFPSKYNIYIDTTSLLSKLNFTTRNSINESGLDLKFNEIKFPKNSNLNHNILSDINEENYRQSNLNLKENKDSELHVIPIRVNKVENILSLNRLEKNEEKNNSIKEVKFSLLDMFFFPCRKTKLSDKYNLIRLNVMSENNIFRLYLNDQKLKKMIFNDVQLTQLKNLRIYEDEIEKLI